MLDYIEYLSSNGKTMIIGLLVFLFLSLGILNALKAIKEVINSFITKKLNKVKNEEKIDKQILESSEELSKHNKDLELLKENIKQTEEDLQSVSNNISSLENSISNHNESLDLIDKKVVLLGTGMQAMLRNEIIKECEYLQEKEVTHITIRQYENLDGLFESYEALGGNHAVSNLRKWFNTLIIDVDD